MYRLKRAPLAALLLHSRYISNTLANYVVPELLGYSYHQPYWRERILSGSFPRPSERLPTHREEWRPRCRSRCSHKNRCYLVLAIAAVYCLRYSRFAIHHVCRLETLVPLLNTHSLSWTHRHIHGSRRDLGIQIGDRIITYTETCTADTGSGAP